MSGFHFEDSLFIYSTKGEIGLVGGRTVSFADMTSLFDGHSLQFPRLHSFLCAIVNGDSSARKRKTDASSSQ